jgi:hypothetical protein
MVEEIDWGFRIFIGESPILGFLTNGSPMKEAARMSLKSLPNNMAWSGSCENIGNILFFHSRVCASSSSFESLGIGMFCFFSARQELSPTPSSCPLLKINIATRISPAKCCYAYYL